jgi:hypothetical protein
MSLLRRIRQGLRESDTIDLTFLTQASVRSLILLTSLRGA